MQVILTQKAFKFGLFCLVFGMALAAILFPTIQKPDIKMSGFPMLSSCFYH
jgi:hypothetical protein